MKGPDVKFSLYLKKASLASRNKVHLPKHLSTLCRFLLLCLFFTLYVKLIRSSLIQRIPVAHRSCYILKNFIVQGAYVLAK